MIQNEFGVKNQEIFGDQKKIRWSKELELEQQPTIVGLKQRAAPVPSPAKSCFVSSGKIANSCDFGIFWQRIQNPRLSCRNSLILDLGKKRQDYRFEITQILTLLIAETVLWRGNHGESDLHLPLRKKNISAFFKQRIKVAESGYKMVHLFEYVNS